MENTTTQSIEALILEKLPKAMSYDTYKELIGRMAKEGVSTGPRKTEALANYTLLNERRMKRFDKTLKIAPENLGKIARITRKLTFLVLTESWCGDAAPTLPVMHKIAEQSPNIDMGILLRDDHLDLMEHFLTDGALSIPKLIIVDDFSGDVLAEWGPRPSKAAKLASEYKKEHGALSADFRESLQLWYNKDKGKNTIEDLLALLPLE